MWLPKDERRLLAVYYLKINEQQGSEVTKEKWYRKSALVEVLRAKSPEDAAKKLKDYFDGGANNQEENHQDELNIEELKKKNKEYLRYLNRVNIANSALVERKLIITRDHETVVEDKPKGVRLTVGGYDSGGKYSSRLGTAWVWCNEYKIWIILSVIIGFITLVVSIIAAILKD